MKKNEKTTNLFKKNIFNHQANIDINMPLKYDSLNFPKKKSIINNMQKMSNSYLGRYMTGLVFWYFIFGTGSWSVRDCSKFFLPSFLPSFFVEKKYSNIR